MPSLVGHLTYEGQTSSSLHFESRAAAIGLAELVEQCC